MTRGNPFVRAFAFCALLIVAALAVAACGSSSNSSNSSNSSKGNSANVAAKGLGTTVFGTVPPAGTPVSGGTLTQGQLTGQTPTEVFPLANSSTVTTGTISLNSEMYMPLFSGPTGAEPKVFYPMSAASGPPVPSNGDKTYTIHLKPGLKWSNGQPLQAKDFLFAIAILKAAVTESPANWAQYVPGEFPVSVVSDSAPNPTTIVLNLNRAYNPGFFLNNQLQDTTTVFPYPSQAWNVDATGGPHLNNWSSPAVAKKIYDYLNKQGTTVSTFASNPLWQVVSGPFKLKSFSATNSSYVMTPNPSYGGTPKARFAQLDVNTYTSYTAELNEEKTGALDVMVGFDPTQIAEMPQLKTQGIDVLGGPSWGWFGGIYNFKDTTDHFDKVIAQNYTRQAIAELTDQQAYIKGIYKGAAVAAYGPVPSAPKSDYAPASATIPPYPYNPAKAAALLKAHGWKVVPNGQSTCAKPGTGAGECGAGIPAGTPFKFVWANQPESVSSVGALESEALASEAKAAAGINITLQTKTFNFLVSNYSNTNPANVKYVNDWGVNNYGGLFTNYYPTADGSWNHPGSGLNTGSFENPTSDALIQKSVYGTNPKAVINEVAYFAAHPPVAFMPMQDYMIAVNTKKVGGAAQGWLSMTQQQWEPNFWYAVK
jgi:peptide/nickel transport system substrate-binding protein